MDERERPEGSPGLSPEERLAEPIQQGMTPGLAARLAALFGHPADAQPGHDGGTWGLCLPFLVAGLLTLSLVSVPTVLLSSPADLSLSAVLNYAHQRGLQFGTEIVCTYGPLGFLIFPCYSPHTGAMRLAVELVLCCTVVTGLCLVAWRLRPGPRFLLLGLFTVAAAGVEPRIDLMVDVGFLCWGLLCFVESGRRLTGCALTFTIFAVFGGLAKVSFLLVGGAGTVLLGCDFLARGRGRLALGVLAGFAGGFALGWMAAGQNLRHLGSFLENGFAVARSYNEALGIEGLALGRQGGIVLGLLALLMVLIRTTTAFAAGESRRPWRRGVLLVWAAMLTLTNWKHGFVRFDTYHAAGTLTFVVVLALGLEILPGDQMVARRWARGSAAVNVLLALALLQGLFFRNVASTLAQPFRAFGQNVARLLHPVAYEQEMNEIIAAVRREAQLPALRALVGRASTDVFGQFQADALDNDLDYRPRPVFQSYSACDRRLMRLNDEFYLSAEAPECVLFNLGPMDSRFPPLEDAWVLRELMVNYEPVGAEGRSLLLRKARPVESPRLTLLREQTVCPSEPIDLRPYGDANLWLEIGLESTWRGRLRQVLYQPSTVRLAAWREPGNGLILRRRAPAAMLASGFLASPLLVRNEDLADLFAGGAGTRPGACSVELVSGQEHFWRTDVRVRIYKLENHLGHRTEPTPFPSKPAPTAGKTGAVPGAAASARGPGRRVRPGMFGYPRLARQALGRA